MDSGASSRLCMPILDLWPPPYVGGYRVQTRRLGVRVGIAPVSCASGYELRKKEHARLVFGSLVRGGRGGAIAREIISYDHIIETGRSGRDCMGRVERRLRTAGRRLRMQRQGRYEAGQVGAAQ